MAAGATTDSARTRAFRLLTARQPRGFIEERATAAAEGLDPRDAGLLRQLALGVTRHRVTLDAVGEGVSGRRARGQDPAVWTAVRLGAFQLLFLDRVPDHAAVDESVALAPPRARGFVNAVLRNVARAVEAHEPPGGARPERAGRDASAGRRTVPTPEGGAVLLDRDVLPDPTSHPDRWLAEAYSVPLWFARRRLDALGLTGAGRVCAACNAPAPLTLRPNPLRGGGGPAPQRPKGAGVPPEAAWSGGGERSGPPPAAIDLVRAGLAAVQDATAQEVAPLLAPVPGERVLDLCAAPGGKALHCAELMRNAGAVVAVDPSGPGLAKLREQAARAGVTIVETIEGDARTVDLPAASFDAVLVDAPCSNTGVWRRRAEARWRASPERLPAFAAVQRALLARAAVLVRPGGRVVYSVCSIEPEEGPWVADVAPASRLAPRAALVRLPGAADGGFAARFAR